RACPARRAPSPSTGELPPRSWDRPLQESWRGPSRSARALHPTHPCAELPSPIQSEPAALLILAIRGGVTRDTATAPYRLGSPLTGVPRRPRETVIREVRQHTRRRLEERVHLRRLRDQLPVPDLHHLDLERVQRNVVGVVVREGQVDGNLEAPTPHVVRPPRRPSSRSHARGGQLRSHDGLAQVDRELRRTADGTPRHVQLVQVHVDETTLRSDHLLGVPRTVDVPVARDRPQLVRQRY